MRSHTYPRFQQNITYAYLLQITKTLKIIPHYIEVIIIVMIVFCFYF
jgi:hypothetical protein